MYKNTKRIIKTFKNSKKNNKKNRFPGIGDGSFFVVAWWEKRKKKKNKNNSDAVMVYNNGIMVNKTTGCEGGKEKIKIFFLYSYSKKWAKKAQILEITNGVIIIIISAMIIPVFFNINIVYRLSFKTVLTNIYFALS